MMNMAISSSTYPQECAPPRRTWKLVKGAIVLTLPAHEAAALVHGPTLEDIKGEPNAHVRAYWWLQTLKDGLTPAEFVRMQAKAEGITYDLLIAHKHKRGLYAARKNVLVKLGARFPRLNCEQLARLVKRHHTAVLYSLGRLSRTQADMTDYHRRRRAELRAAAI